MRTLRYKSVFASRVRSCGIALLLPLSIVTGACLVSPTVAQAQEPQRIPGKKPLQTGAVAGTVLDQRGRPVQGARVEFKHQSQPPVSTTTNGEGIYRLPILAPGDYDVTVTSDGIEPFSKTLQVLAATLEVLDFQVTQTNPTPDANPGPVGIPGAGRTAPIPEATVDAGSLPVTNRVPEPESAPASAAPEVVPGERDNFILEPYRWAVQMPDWQRYPKKGEFPYTTSHWYDPFNRNRLKGDKPIFGQRWFLNLTGDSTTSLDVRRLPTPSNVATEAPGEINFFGRGEQAFVDQQFRFSFDLFRGDTSFQPIQFRARFTPVVDLNFLQTRELGIVNASVTEGTNRFDTHTGIQEAFVEAKIRDLSPNFDFVSIRAGIQGFSSDFRGFIFANEEPGIRVFGNLHSNRLNYNLAYFYLLEKDTNSGLNTFEFKHQQVGIANVYIQDSIAKGYTTEFSFHYNYDQGDVHYDKNGFLVRPEPIGAVVQKNGVPVIHDVRAYYLGWTGNGHIGGVNVSNAFYQVLGTDSYNPIAQRPLHINAQMGALELSKDHDWFRYRASVFWASGDTQSNVNGSRSGTARGFDSILDDTQFAGGQFSFFDQQQIRLTGTGVALVTPESLLPSLRSSKDEGQANFVNPGVRVYNVGFDANITPKLRGFANVSYLQFDRTQVLSNLLFQSNVHRSIGTDSGIGVSYRPPLTENIVITTGVSNLVPGLGLRNIYNSRVLVSAFAKIRFEF
jgi:Carboxypeptidase regulatory-like domain